MKKISKNSSYILTQCESTKSVRFIVRLHSISGETTSSMNSYADHDGSSLVASVRLRNNFTIPLEHLKLLNDKEEKLKQLDKSIDHCGDDDLNAKTIPTLKQILKENGIKFKSNDKKKVLIEKLEDFFKHKE